VVETCKQQFTGEMCDGLANALWSAIVQRTTGRGFLPRSLWLTPSGAKESALRRRRCSARCLQWNSGCWEPIIPTR
jgi:hypothetical protein